MLLTIHTTVVTRIPRFLVSREDKDVWTLRVSSIAREDKGAYMCQVNTEPQMSQTYFLDVVGEYI